MMVPIDIKESILEILVYSQSYIENLKADESLSQDFRNPETRAKILQYLKEAVSADAYFHQLVERLERGIEDTASQDLTEVKVTLARIESNTETLTKLYEHLEERFERLEERLEELEERYVGLNNRLTTWFLAFLTILVAIGVGVVGLYFTLLNQLLPLM